MTGDWHWPQFVQCGSTCWVIYSVQLCGSGVQSCILWVFLPLLPSLLLCTGCHSINHSSSLEFLKTSRVWVLSQTCWIRHARGLSRRVFGFSETSLGHSDAQPELRTTVSLKIYIYIALWCCFCTAKWISYMFTYIPSFSDFLPI